MNLIKQSTACTLLIGPFLDDGDGKSAETGLTISQADVRLSKNGGNMAQKSDSTACTHDELGYYTCPLNTTDTNTLGILRVMVHESGALPVWYDCQVVTANVYDTLCSTDSFDVNVTAISGDATAADNCELMFDGTGYAGGTTKLGVDAVAISGDTTAANNLEAACDGTGYNIGGGDVVAASVTAGVTLANDAITAAKFDESTAFPLKSADTGATAVARTGADSDTLETLSDQMDAMATDADVADAILDEALSGHTTAGTLGQAINDILTDTGTTLDGKLDAIDDYVDTEVAAIKAVTDKLDTALELDGAVYRYTTNALEQAPTGGSAPSAADIADAVWDEALAGHADVGSAGAGLTAAASAGDPWATALPGSYAAGTAGKIIGDNINAPIGTVDTVVDGLATTLGAAGAGLTAVPWNASWDAEVQSECTDALNAYDPPTKTEMDSGLAAVPAAVRDVSNTAPAASSLGAAVNSAASAGDPWATALPGSYAAGTAGKIIGDNINAPIGTVDTVVDAIKAVTDNLPDSGALTSLPTASEIRTEMEESGSALAVALYNTTFIASASQIRAELEEAGSHLAYILADTDELQTNQGDWATATGFSTHSAADVKTAIEAAGGSIAAILEDTGTTLDTLVKDIPTNSELATALTAADDAVLAAVAALNDFDPAADVVAHVTLVDTTTTNTDMVAAAPSAADIKTAIEAAGSHLTLILEDTGTTLPAAITALTEAGVKKNTALDNFTFYMTDSTNHAASTDLTVTAERSIDGAAFAACANAVTELSDGCYTIDLAADDLNGDVVVLKFTADDTDNLLFTIKTSS